MNGIILAGGSDTHLYPLTNCSEKRAFSNGWLDANTRSTIAEPLQKCGYGEYLLSIIDEKLF